MSSDDDDRSVSAVIKQKSLAVWFRQRNYVENGFQFYCLLYRIHRPRLLPFLIRVKTKFIRKLEFLTLLNSSDKNDTKALNLAYAFKSICPVMNPSFAINLMAFTNSLKVKIGVATFLVLGALYTDRFEAGTHTSGSFSINFLTRLNVTAFYKIVFEAD